MNGKAKMRQLHTRQSDLGTQSELHTFDLWNDS